MAYGSDLGNKSVLNDVFYDDRGTLAVYFGFRREDEPVSDGREEYGLDIGRHDVVSAHEISICLSHRCKRERGTGTSSALQVRITPGLVDKKDYIVDYLLVDEDVVCIFLHFQEGADITYLFDRIERVYSVLSGIDHGFLGRG